jgi:GT2 family glycosyltransferase
VVAGAERHEPATPPEVSPGEHPRVSVVVPSLGGLPLLLDTIQSLSLQSFRDFEIAVVDNGSLPPLPSDLSAGEIPVTVVRLETNRGVAAALNHGVEATTGELVALLNNDVELEPTWLERLVDALDEHPDAGSVTGKLLMHHDRSLLDGAGDVLYTCGAAVRRGYAERDVGQYDRTEWIFSACGAAAVYRRSVLVDVGAFDVDFYAYLEDVDWGFRAQLLGYRCLYVPSGVAYHIGSATTTANAASRRMYEAHLQRNALTLLVKDFPAWTLVRSSPAIALFHAHWLIKSYRSRLLRPHLGAYREALRELPRTLRKRSAIQQRRRVGLSSLQRVLTPYAPWRRRSLNRVLRSRGRNETEGG